jgi:hypothetical protein
VVRTAVFDPIVVEPQLTTEKVRELIERGRESAKLDYKETFDLSSTVHKVRLVKHILAMANTAGGYIVIGVADDGTRMGLPSGLATKLDEAAIRSQVAGYTKASVPVFVDAPVVHDSKEYAIITVLPLMDRIAVAESAGGYADAGKQKTMFNKGDVLVRHGSASERWNQDDADYLLTRIASAQKDAWAEEFGKDLRRLSKAAGGGPLPIDEGVYELPAAEFQKIVIDLMRSRHG